MSKRKYRIVIIDDDNKVPFTQKLIGHKVMGGNCEIINFTDLQCLSSRTKRNGLYHGLSAAFITLLKTSVIDIVACDVNLGDGESDTGMHMRIVDDIKRNNKTLKILSYSGNIGSQIAYAIADSDKSMSSVKITNLLNILLNCCDGFEERREVVRRLNEMLGEKRNDIELEYILENVYPDCAYVFSNGKSCTGKEIAQCIRNGDSKGSEFVNRAVEFGIDNVEALFS